MPPEASEQLSIALAAACDDPLGATLPYGVDDGVVRTLVTDHAIAVLLIGHQSKTLTVVQLNYLG